MPRLDQYGGAQRFVVECIRRWQHRHRLTIYSSRVSNSFFEEHRVDRAKVELAPLTAPIDGPHGFLLNGLLLPILLIAILRLVNDREVMGEYRNGPIYNAAAWLTTIVVSGLSLFFMVTKIFPNIFK